MSALSKVFKVWEDSHLTVAAVVTRTWVHTYLEELEWRIQETNHHKKNLMIKNNDQKTKSGCRSRTEPNPGIKKNKKWWKCHENHGKLEDQQ